MPTTQRDRYTAVAMLLHWLIAAALIFQILLGWRMGWAPKGSLQGYALFQLHKSVGITILLLSLIRLGWRLTHPAPHVDQPAWEAMAAKAVHIGFYVIMLGLPITGWIMVSVSRTNIPTILYGMVPWPHFPFLSGLAAGQKLALSKASTFSHESLVKVTYALLALHLGAVAKHQILDRDAVFSHMAAGAKPGWREPRLWLVAAVVAVVLAAGFLYTPGIKPASPPAAPPAPVETAASAPAAPTAVSSAPAPQSAAEVASAAPAAASSAAPAPTTPQPPVHWTVRSTSTLSFASSWSGAPINGRFNHWTADILFSPTALDKSHLTVSVDIASVSTGDEQRDSTLPTEDWFNATAFPKATFTATKFRKTGEDRFVADGTLDLRGVKKPVALPFSLKIDGKTATAKGAVSLDRTLFGIGQGEWASTDSIPAAVAVSIALVADSAP